MGMDGAADAFSFNLITMAHLCEIVRNEYDAPEKFERFYQIYQVINKAIELTIRKLDMVPNNERRTQTIANLYKFTAEQWWHIRKGERS